jgi:TonB-dependent SusC/RagA subfamily outer membrane receptor
MVQLISTGFVFLLFSHAVLGQQRVVEGMVTTLENIALANVTVEAKSNSQEVLTDSLGMFTIACAPKDRLKFKAHGFAIQKVRIKEKTKYLLVNLRLLPGPENRKLAVGYGHVSDADNLYAISNVNEGDINFARYRDIYEILTGLFASSVQVRGNGDIIIRGTITMASDNTALLIVDGREVDAIDFGNINTSDIASINVLKDASAAVYGSRGGNGVIIVETKRGW